MCILRRCFKITWPEGSFCRDVAHLSYIALWRETQHRTIQRQLYERPYHFDHWSHKGFQLPWNRRFDYKILNSVCILLVIKMIQIHNGIQEILNFGIWKQDLSYPMAELDSLHVFNCLKTLLRTVLTLNVVSISLLNCQTFVLYLDYRKVSRILWYRKEQKNNWPFKSGTSSASLIKTNKVNNNTKLKKTHIHC